MKSLEHMPLGKRIMITFVIVVIILFALAAFGYYSGGWDKADAQAREPDLYAGVPHDEKLLALDKAALDAAYSAHLAKLWNVWLSDGAKEAHRITTGLKIARESYRQAANRITERERQLPK